MLKMIGNQQNTMKGQTNNFLRPSLEIILLTAKMSTVNKRVNTDNQKTKQNKVTQMFPPKYNNQH